MEKLLKILWNVIGICLGILMILSAIIGNSDFAPCIFTVCLAIWLLANKTAQK